MTSYKRPERLKNTISFKGYKNRNDSSCMFFQGLSAFFVQIFNEIDSVVLHDSMTNRQTARENYRHYYLIFMEVEIQLSGLCKGLSHNMVCVYPQICYTQEFVTVTWTLL